MLDINYVRAHPDAIREMLRLRNAEPSLLQALEQALEADARRRSLLAEAEKLKAERNAASKAIGRAKDSPVREAKIAEMKQVGDRIAALDEKLRTVAATLQRALGALPNLPDARTPVGRDESENVIVRTAGEPKELPFAPKAHWDLGPALGIIDFEQAARMTGSRFFVLHGAGARLQRALSAWMLELHLRQGYREVYPPFLVREEAMFGAGQLPKFADNLYRDAEEDLWMIPTAEVPLTNLHAGEILDAERLPLRYTACTACFRREKAAAGRDVRGIKRVHQFEKVEMYIYCTPETADAECDRMLADAEAVCAGLGLLHRVKQLCTGDLGFTAVRTYDIEVWSPGVGEWLEVSSVSHCGDFQARRSAVRYRPAKGAKPVCVHTLNGSGLALPRTVIAILENYQTPEGEVVIPEPLRPLMGGVEIIRKE
jgi:seryl-tRNA synthetase